MSSSKVDRREPPTTGRRRALSTPAVLSVAAVVVGGGVYLLVPHLGTAYGDVDTGQSLRLTSSTVVVGAGDTGSVTVQGEVRTALTRCVQVRFTGPGPGRVELRVDAGQQPAAVTVRVERGESPPVGGDGECPGFRPAAEVFAGPLAELSQPGRAAAWLATPKGESTYRLTFTPAGTDGPSTPLSALFLWSGIRPSGSVLSPQG